MSSKKLAQSLEQINSIHRRNTKRLNKDRDFYRDSAYDLLGDVKWLQQAVKTLVGKLQIAYDHNEELLDKVNAYNGGLVDKEFINKRQDPRKDVRNIEKWSDEEGKVIKVGKHYKYPYETYVDKLPSKPKQTIKLQTIIDSCKTDLQRQVVKFYYDKNLDSYGSKQKVANWLYPGDKHGRQKVNQILNTIATYMTKVITDHRQ